MHRLTTAPAGPALDIPIEDWNALFSAVLARLSVTASTHLATDPALQAALLESVDALHKLQAGLEQERALRSTGEVQIQLLHSALPPVIRQLLGSSALPLTLDFPRFVRRRSSSLPNTEF